MKFVLAASALALSIAPASAQNAALPPTTPKPTPIATAAPVTTQPVKPPVRRARVRKPVSPGVARVAAANRAATQEPQAQAFVNALQVYPFSDGTIYQVYTAPGAVTDLALQPGENLIAVAAGDTVRWVIGDTTSGAGTDKRTHILVKPFATGLATNLIITTDRRSYHLQLTATSRTAMAALSWTYPADQLIALRRAADQAAAAAPVADGLSIDSLHFNYRLSGDSPAWRPLRAFDDGRQTFVEFAASIAVGEAPPLFVIGPTGDAELVNYRVRGRFYVVDRIFDAAELRLGTKKQQIVRIDRVAEGDASRKGKRS
ncbi:P-type conjugative transfer protein TrbG [Sphingomonas fennica]|uniref:P-type conjugative transfer protein TrbG n=1 Tax=Edaphosphingomonas fennica TaxID=114404 RepID=A0A2T4I7T8_9SPHN|nr:P-type conjugative transfer protein TrbG [Sphingomonas fennica]PTD27463.1 P-type conjugative transfer protein TrbG [Sphingomonas fennica]